MDILNVVFAQVSELARTLLTNALLNGIGFAILGLIGGIFLVIRLNRKEAFHRPHPIWTFLSKINLVYLPIVLALFLGANGLVIGLQKTCNKWIDVGTQPVVEYANAYLPTLQAAAMNMDLSRALTLEEMIALELGNKQGSSTGGYTEDIMFHYNSAIAGALLEELGYPSEIDETVRVLRDLDLSRIDQHFFNQIPDAIKSYAGNYFLVLYQMILTGFLPFLLIPVLEYGIYLLVKSSGSDGHLIEDELV